MVARLAPFSELVVCADSLPACDSPILTTFYLARLMQACSYISTSLPDIKVLIARGAAA